jgi:hypothetical protein
MSGKSDPIVGKEQDLRLYEVRVLGISLWRLIRVPIVESFLAERGGDGRSNFNNLDIRRLPHMFAGVLRSLWHVLRLRQRPFLIAGFPRRRLEDGEWVDPFSDPLVECLGEENVLCIERPFGGEHCLPQRTRNVVHYDWISALSTLASVAGAPLASVLFRREIAALTARVQRMGPVPARRIRILSARFIIRFWVERAAAAVLLAIARPRALLLTLRRHHHPLIHACRRRGIPVYELQHGAMADGGFKYSTPYDPLLDPDLFLTFGEYWNDSDWGMPPASVVAVGFKFIADKKARVAEAPVAGRTKVMLVSQPHEWQLLESAFSGIVAAHPDVSFILKLHPQDVGRWWERYPSGNAPNVEVCGGLYPDLYDLFAQCDCVCGYDSTVLFEASFLGLKVGILNLDGRNRCPALEFDGRFNFQELRTTAEFGELLNRTAAADPGAAHPFFAPFDRERFLRVIRQGPATIDLSAPSCGRVEAR